MYRPELFDPEIRARHAYAELVKAENAYRELPASATAEERHQARRRVAVAHVHHAVAEELLRRPQAPGVPSAG